MAANDATLAYLALYVWGSECSPFLEQPQQVAWLQAIAQTLSDANVNPATAAPAQIYAANSIVNAHWTYQPTTGGFAIDNPAQVLLEAQAQIPPSQPGYVPISVPCPPSTPPVTTAPPPTPPPSSPSKPPTPPPTTSGSTGGTGGGKSGFIDDFCSVFPDAPSCSGTTFYGNLPGIIIVNPGEPSGSGGSPNVNITLAGPSGADVTGAVDSALGDLWGTVVGAVDAVIAEAVAALQSAISAIGAALQAAWGILARLGGLILGAIEAVVQKVVAGLIKVLEEARDLAGDLYKKVLQPIANAIGQIKKALLDAYTRFIRPMLIVLQDLRKFLAILAAFHVSFAQKLDAKLADLERRITQPLFYLLSFVNGVANWINLIITAGYLLQKSVFLNSLLVYVGEALNLQFNAMNQPLTPASIAAAKAADTTQPTAQSAADMSAFLQGSGGALPADLTPYTAQLDQYLQGGIS